MISLLGGHIKLIKMIPYLYQSLRFSYHQLFHFSSNLQSPASQIFPGKDLVHVFFEMQF